MDERTLTVAADIARYGLDEYLEARRQVLAEILGAAYEGPAGEALAGLEASAFDEAVTGTPSDD